MIPTKLTYCFSALGMLDVMLSMFDYMGEGIFSWSDTDDATFVYVRDRYKRWGRLSDQLFRTLRDTLLSWDNYVAGLNRDHVMAMYRSIESFHSCFIPHFHEEVVARVYHKCQSYDSLPRDILLYHYYCGALQGVIVRFDQFVMEMADESTLFLTQCKANQHHWLDLAHALGGETRSFADYESLRDDIAATSRRL